MRVKAFLLAIFITVGFSACVKQAEPEKLYNIIVDNGEGTAMPSGSMKESDGRIFVEISALASKIGCKTALRKSSGEKYTKYFVFDENSELWKGHVEGYKEGNSETPIEMDKTCLDSEAEMVVLYFSESSYWLTPGEKRISAAVWEYSPAVLTEKVSVIDGKYYICADDIGFVFECRATISDGLVKIETLPALRDSVKDNAAKWKMDELDTDSYSFLANRVIARKGNSWFLLDFSGEKVTEDAYKAITYLHSTHHFMINKDDKFGIIDKNAAQIIPTDFYWINYYSVLPFYTVETEDLKFGLYDLEGKEVLAPIYDRVGSSSFSLMDTYTSADDFPLFEDSDRLGVQKDGKWGMFDLEGNQIMPFDYDMLGLYEESPAKSSFHLYYPGKEGSAVIVKSDVFYGAVDKNGKLVVPLTVDKPQFEEDKPTAAADLNYIFVKGQLIGSYENGRWLSVARDEKPLSLKAFTIGSLLEQKGYRLFSQTQMLGAAEKVGFQLSSGLDCAISETMNGLLLEPSAATVEKDESAVKGIFKLPTILPPNTYNFKISEYNGRWDLGNENALLMISANINPLPASIISGEPASEADISAVKKELSAFGISGSPANITGVADCDLDGDGTIDRIIIANTPRDSNGYPVVTEQEKKSGKAGAYSIALVKIGGEYSTVSSHFVKYAGDIDINNMATASIDYSSRFELFGVFDLNGDGKLEIVLQKVFWEGGNFSVSSLEGEDYSEVLVSRFGT